MKTLDTENNMVLFVKRADKYKPLIKKWNISHTIIAKKMGINRTLLYMYMNNGVESDFTDTKFIKFLKVIRELKEDLTHILDN